MPKTDSKSVVTQFYKFINEHRSDKDNMTHTTLIKGAGAKYCFTGQSYSEFLEKYISVLKSGSCVDLHFVERPNKNGVTFLFIDVDFDHDGSKRIYTQKHIKEIIKKTNDFLCKNFKVTKYQLSAFVTEKPKPTKRDKGDLYKDGFHIYYPYLAMEEKHRYYVIDYLCSLMVDGKLMNGIDYKNGADKIFDTSIIKSNGILMIGSKKQEGYPYQLTHIYNFDLNDIGTDGYDDEELVYTFSNQQYDVDAKVEAVDDSEVEDNIEEIYQRYTGGNKKKKTPTKNYRNDDVDDDDDESDVKSVGSSVKVVRRRTAQQQKEYEMAKELVKILSKNRAHDYVSWRRVGFALRAIDDELYNDFVQFSKKDMSKYKEGKITCEDIWKAAKGYTQFYSIGTLRHWARTDSPKEYNKIIRVLYDDLFGRAETGKHVDIADVIHALYKDRFVCIDIAKKKWYEFQDHRWVFVQSAYTLEELISSEVRGMMSMYFSEKLARSVENMDGFHQDTENKRYQKLMKLIENLGDVKFRENVVRACANKFYDATFQAKLDTNVYLVGFTNGVYDLKDMCFRDGLPTDYLSKTVGYDWKEYDENDPIFEKINRFFSEVQIEVDMREYLLTFIAKTLRGVPDTKLHIWTGGGGNGKSATVDLIKHLLGDLFGVLPVTVLTRKRGNSSSASPEFADKFGKRFLVIQEPEHNDVVYVGQMKEYTGKDTIMARPLYGDPFYYTPQFTMVLTCNNLPYIPATDDGTWRRLRVTPYESVFVDEDPKGKNQFLKDEDLQEDFPNWAQPLMYLIITKYYPIYEKGINGKRYKLNEPAKVKQHTNNYKLDSDVYAEFLEENIARTDSDADKETIPFVYQLFKDWYSSSYSEKAPAKKNFVAYLKKSSYKIDSGGQNLVGVKYALSMSG